MRATRVVCPGSFDPITLGHLDIIRRARDLFGDVVVAVGVNPQKKYLFGDRRIELVRDAVAGLEGVEVAEMDGLIVDFCAERGISAVVKGIRFGSDFDFEVQMAHMNHGQTGLETVLLPAAAEYLTLSSTLLRTILVHGGDVTRHVPPNVAEAIARRDWETANSSAG